MLVPHPLEQLLGRHGRSVGGHQDLQDRKLLAGQLDLGAGTGQPPPCGVELELGVAQNRGPARAGPPGEGLDPGHELGEAEGLGQVVVGAERQAVDHVLERPRRGQHQDPGLGPLTPHGAAHVVTVHARQIAVEHEHVVADHARLDQRLLAVGSQIHGHPLAPQATGDRVRKSKLVLGDQHTHPVSMNGAP